MMSAAHIYYFADLDPTNVVQVHELGIFKFFSHKCCKSNKGQPTTSDDIWDMSVFLFVLETIN